MFFTHVFQVAIDRMLLGFKLSLTALLFAARNWETSLYLEALHKQPICWKTASFCHSSVKLNFPYNIFKKLKSQMLSNFKIKDLDNVYIPEFPPIVCPLSDHRAASNLQVEPTHAPLQVDQGMMKGLLNQVHNVRQL